MFENDAEMVVIDSSKLYKSDPNVPITDQQINESMVGCSAQNLTIHEDLG
jgi:aspartate-semialdehyde dehydrogenase